MDRERRFLVYAGFPFKYKAFFWQPLKKICQPIIDFMISGLIRYPNIMTLQVNAGNNK